jgi:hypothetical protein
VADQVEDTDLGWNEIIGKIERANGKSTKVGVVGAAARRRMASGLTVAQVAAVHEFGSPEANVPERSFIRAAVDDNRDAIVDEVDRVCGAILEPGPDELRAGLETIGAQVAGFIQDKIRSGLEPALEASTVEANGGETRPLAAWLSESQALEHEEADGEEPGDS